MIMDFCEKVMDTAMNKSDTLNKKLKKENTSISTNQ